jgi:hypothetical protein
LTANETDSDPTVLRIEGQLADDAPRFAAVAGDVSARARTVAAVSWTPSSWSAGAAGPDQRTPDLAPVVQEIIDRPGWERGNALALVLTGTGRRVAEAFDGAAQDGPRLELMYVGPSGGTTTTTAGDGSTTTTATSPTSTTTMPGERTTIEVRIAASADDATERSSGIVSLTSRELEVVGDGGTDCAAGERCTGSCACVQDDGAPRVSFSGQVQPILTRHCATPACHGGRSPAQGLDLRSPTAYGTLIAAPSTQCVDLMLVAPGAAHHSYLSAKLHGFGSCFVGERMPPTRPLSDADITTISTWIAQGAPAN